MNLKKMTHKFLSHTCILIENKNQRAWHIFQFQFHSQFQSFPYEEKPTIAATQSPNTNYATSHVKSIYDIFLKKNPLYFSDHLTISVYTETDSSHFVAYDVK